MIKTKFKDSLRSKTRTAQVNELLLKILYSSHLTFFLSITSLSRLSCSDNLAFPLLTSTNTTSLIFFSSIPLKTIKSIGFPTNLHSVGKYLKSGKNGANCSENRRTVNHFPIFWKGTGQMIRIDTEGNSKVIEELVGQTTPDILFKVISLQNPNLLK